MPQLGSLVINDGLATPVAHTFVPVAIRDDVALWTDRSPGVPVGFNTASASLGYNKSTRAYKYTVKMTAPTLETLGNSSTGFTPPATKAYECGVSIQFWLPERATLQNRKDILAYAKNMLASAVVTAGVQDLEAVY